MNRCDLQKWILIVPLSGAMFLGWATELFGQAGPDYLVTPVIAQPSEPYFQISSERSASDHRTLIRKPASSTVALPSGTAGAVLLGHANRAGFDSDFAEEDRGPLHDPMVRPAISIQGQRNVMRRGQEISTTHYERSIHAQDAESDDPAAAGEDDDESAQSANQQRESLFDRQRRAAGQGNDLVWNRKSIQDIRIDLQDTAAVVPEDRSDDLDYGTGDWRGFHAAPKTFAWLAPDIRYQPLYFEDVALERYGQTFGFHRQTVRSARHFLRSTVFFPNHLRHDPPFSCDHPLGFCRPGSPTPLIQERHWLGRPN